MRAAGFISSFNFITFWFSLTAWSNFKALSSHIPLCVRFIVLSLILLCIVFAKTEIDSGVRQHLYKSRSVIYVLVLFLNNASIRYFKHMGSVKLFSPKPNVLRAVLYLSPLATNFMACKVRPQWFISRVWHELLSCKNKASLSKFS